MAKKRASTASFARRFACGVLRATREREGYVREIFDARKAELAGRGQAPDARELDFARAICIGVTACLGTLDELIDRNLDSPRDVKPKLRDALRISAWEMLFSRREDYAVVDQGVELARFVAPRAAGLANAVLRKMARDAKGFPWGDVAADMAALSRAGGMPEWLTRRLADAYGLEDARAMLAALLEAAPVYTVSAPRGHIASDLAAQHVAGLVPLSGSVLEVGAGRGTKTALMQLRSLDERGRGADIHALDVHAFKGELLHGRLVGLGLPDVETHVGDGRRLDEVGGLPSLFDAVLVDAPCSGTGTFRRHPEGRWRLAPEDVDSLVSLQGALLASAAGRVACGGTLLYSTCSVLPAENEGVVRAFLVGAAGATFTRMPLPGDFAEPNWRTTGEGAFQSLPAAGRSDGHFAAAFTRTA